MELKETLHQPEQEQTKNIEKENLRTEISLHELEALYLERRRQLDELRPFVYLKLYNLMSDKLDSEKKQFEKLLNWQSARDEALAQYSFVLNPYFFEQKFFNRNA